MVYKTDFLSGALSLFISLLLFLHLLASSAALAKSRVEAVDKYL
jgi:hypothetical protein